MTNSKPQPDIDFRRIGELLDTLHEALPALEKLAAVARAFCEQENGLPQHKPCESCPEKGHCSAPCEKLDAWLPGIYEGRKHWESSSRMNRDVHPNLSKVRFTDVFEEYESCHHIFTSKQWAVIRLYYGEEKTQEQIARQLHKLRSAVSGRLVRAKRKKEQHDRKIRQEKFAYLRREIEE